VIDERRLSKAEPARGRYSQGTELRMKTVNEGWPTAVHEAGHAIVAATLGLEVQSLVINT
jgi:hypothetical protein